MKINEYLFSMKKIELHNFRCFEHLPLIFSDKVNLLIGDNSSGKTTLIRAVSSVLNSFFIGFSDENTRFIGLSKDDFRIAESETGLANEEPIKVNFQFIGCIAALELNSKKGRTLQMPLETIKMAGKELYDGLFNQGKQILALPLLASFSTSDIHSTRKFNKEKFKKYEQKPSFGYYECMQGDGFLDYWTTRLLILREANTGELEVQGVTDALINALGPNGCNVINDIHIRPIRGKIYYYLNDGRATETANLSDGLRRLVNIVLDIAFRCMLLNKGIYGLKACIKTEGTVLIDEIDLHLHPTLQSIVIKGLQRAFPELQFIITSHAPMVMTSIPIDPVNKIIMLEFNSQDGYSAKEIETYGLDASTIIQAVLGLTPRSKEVEERLKTLFDLIDIDDYAKATEKLIEMRNEFGDRLPELAKAQGMLNFLSSSEDDSNIEK
jgi:predicted ATP-binding protein involved in virulence